MQFYFCSYFISVSWERDVWDSSRVNECGERNTGVSTKEDCFDSACKFLCSTLFFVHLLKPLMRALACITQCIFPSLCFSMLWKKNHLDRFGLFPQHVEMASKWFRNYFIEQWLTARWLHYPQQHPALCHWKLLWQKSVWKAANWILENWSVITCLLKSSRKCVVTWQAWVLNLICA